MYVVHPQHGGATSRHLPSVACLVEYEDELLPPLPRIMHEQGGKFEGALHLVEYEYELLVGPPEDQLLDGLGPGAQRVTRIQHLIGKGVGEGGTLGEGRRRRIVMMMMRRMMILTCRITSDCSTTWRRSRM
jgi:hypothetical protein